MNKENSKKKPAVRKTVSNLSEIEIVENPAAEALKLVPKPKQKQKRVKPEVVKKPQAEKPKKTAERILTSTDWVSKVIRAMFTGKLVTHYMPHLDEIISFLLIRDDAGKEVFPGLNIFTEDGELNYEAIEWRRDNPLEDEWKSRPNDMFLGLGGSPYDEHPKGGRRPKKDEAACTLVARDIGTDRCPWTMKLVDDTCYEDRNGGAQEGDVAHLLKMLYRNCGHNIQGIKDAIRFGLMAGQSEIDFLKLEYAEFLKRFKNPDDLRDAWSRYLNGIRGSLNVAEVKDYLVATGVPQKDIQWFHEMIRIARNYEQQAKKEARRLLEAEGVYYPIDLNGELVYICALESNNLEVPKVCWKYHGRRVAILVHRYKETGGVSILTNREIPVDLCLAGQKLQRNERQPGVEWHVDIKGRFVLNGSERFTDVKPTPKSIQDIVRFLQTQLDDDGRTRMGKRFSELPHLA